MTAGKGRFRKLAPIFDEHINLLLKRNLSIGDEALTRHYLRFIGYFRLSAYLIPFQYGGTESNTHHFKSGPSFEKIIDFYVFDRKLRLLVVDAVERIEVAIKAVISDVASIQHGPHWYTNQEYFGNIKWHAEFVDKPSKDSARNNSDIVPRHLL